MLHKNEIHSGTFLYFAAILGTSVRFSASKHGKYVTFRLIKFNSQLYDMIKQKYKCK